jgi:hypothetical protein
VSEAKVTLSCSPLISSRGHRGCRGGSSQLRELILSDTPGSAWKELAKSSADLERFSLYNVVVADADVEEIMTANTLNRLTDVRCVQEDYKDYQVKYR